MNSRTITSLVAALCLATSAQAYTGYGNDNPFVEAMLRMMQIMGLIDRVPSYPGVPYMPGVGGYPGFGAFPGMSPPGAWGGVPGMGPMGGIGGWPGGVPGYPGGGWYGQGRGTAAVADLDGVWELSNGTFVLIGGQRARLHVSRDRYQDFTIGYDGRHFWWSPRGSNTTTRYRYQMRDGRMILRDNDGQVLLMRRRN
ncbi:MAG: hypothetical protein QNJ91_12620 [Gammaproteobacteria bacterium]|nr:hypothetical protein [Gammaproteobacteria bacterium]